SAAGGARRQRGLRLDAAVAAGHAPGQPGRAGRGPPPPAPAAPPHAGLVTGHAAAPAGHHPGPPPPGARGRAAAARSLSSGPRSSPRCTRPPSGPCHPERSEGSALPARVHQIPRCARDDSWSNAARSIKAPAITAAACVTVAPERPPSAPRAFLPSAPRSPPPPVLALPVSTTQYPREDPMPKLSHVCIAAGIAAAAGLAGMPAAAQDRENTSEEDAMPATAADPYLWLEDVTGDRQLAWVREQNARTEAELAGAPGFDKLEADILAVLDSDAKIPYVGKRGDYYYNFWQDAQHERGIWRRTTLEEYRRDEPKWETLLDLDALNKAEGENWVWHGADCLRPDYDRCLIALSRGGADAHVTRESALTTKQLVEDGFLRPEAKGSLGWIDRDTVYVATDFGPGSMT